MPYARLKVLVAVSDEPLAQTLCGFFQSAGAALVERVPSMYRAADAMLEQDFKLFVLDGQLLYSQDKNRFQVAGPDFIRFVRMCKGPVADAPILFVRSPSHKVNLLEARAEIEEARKAGANAVLPQPLDLSALNKAVWEVLAEGPEAKE